MESEKMSHPFKSYSWAALIGLSLGAMLFAWTMRAWASGTVATGVLGQQDFTHSVANTPDPASLSVGNNAVATAVDKSSGHLYVTDFNNNRVLGYSSVGALANGGPADLVIGQPDLFSVSANAPIGFVNAGGLNGPHGVAVDSNHNVYVGDTGNNRVLVFSDPFAIKMSTGRTAGFTAFMVFGQAGDFTSNAANAGSTNASGQQASKSTLSSPFGLALDSGNNLYVADTGNHRVLDFNNPVATSNMSANTVFGQMDFTHNSPNQGGSPLAKNLSSPEAAALDSNGNLYVADSGNNRVLFYSDKTGFSNDESATQVWGSFSIGTCNQSSTISATTLCNPTGVALDSSNNVYIADQNNNRVLEYTESANPPTNHTANSNLLFGQSNFTSFSCNQSSTPSATTVCLPSGLSLDSSNDLFVFDANNNRVLEYLNPLPGTGGTPGTPGSADDTTADIVLGQAVFNHISANGVDASSFNNPLQAALDKSATPNHLYLADENNHRVLGWLNATSFTNGQPADLVIGQPDFQSSSQNRGGSVSGSGLSSPIGVAVDTGGNLYVAEFGNNSRVLEFTNPFASCSGSFPCVFAGSANKVFGQPNATSSGCNLNTATINASTLCNPTRVAVDSVNNLYVTDYNNNRVLEYNTPLTSTGVSGSGDTQADLVFGQGTVGNEFMTNGSNQGGLSDHSLRNPEGVAADSSNNIYVADFTNNRVLEYNETTNATTAPSNVVANNVFGEGGSFTTINFQSSNFLSADSLVTPVGVNLDSSDNLFVADYGNHRMMEYFTPLPGTGGTPGTPGSADDTTADIVSGQGGSFESNLCNLSFGSGPSAATLCHAQDVVVDGSGNTFITDTSNQRLLLFNPPFTSPGAVAPPVPSNGRLSVKPAALAFSSMTVGKHSRSQKLTVKNTGRVPVRLGDISATAMDFMVAGTCGNVLPVGASCTLDVTFKPVTIGNRGGELLISDNARSSPHEVWLSGRGLRRRHSR